MEKLTFGKYEVSNTGIAFNTKVRKTRGSLFHTIPKEVCVGCNLTKGQELKNYLVKCEDGRFGLVILFEESYSQ